MDRARFRQLISKSRRPAKSGFAFVDTEERKVTCDARLKLSRLESGRAPEEPLFANHCLISSHLCRFVEKRSTGKVSAVAQPHTRGSFRLIQ